MFTSCPLLTQASLGSTLHGFDWLIIVLSLVGTTLVAFKMKGDLKTIRDFFLADRSLPWVAICFALMATEVSAASYTGVPYLAYSGSLVYLQLAIGAIVARFIIGYYFVPAFYEEELYSPYQYVGRRFGLGAERVTSALFMLGAIVGQSARVFILAKVMQIITGVSMPTTILVVAALAVLWAAIGGLRTVVWTNVVQFGVLAAGALATALFLVTQSEGGLSHMLSEASRMGKLRLLDFSFDHALELTIWTGLFGSTFNTLASNGADQMNAQYLFCCRSPGEARKAIIASSLNQVFVLVLLFVGIGMFVYCLDYPNQFAKHSGSINADNIFALFVAAILPAGLKGLLVAGLLAAGISSVNAAVAALSQTTLRWLNMSARADMPTDDPAQVRYARLFIVLWGLALVVAAFGFQSMDAYSDVVALALRLTSFTYGALIGSLLLAFCSSRRTSRGIAFGASFAVLTAFGMIWHEAWAHYLLIGGVGALAVLWFYAMFHEIEMLPRIKDQETYVRHAWYLLVGEFPRVIWLLAASAVALSTHWSVLMGDEPLGGQFNLAWPWYLPMGVGITIVFGYLLGRPAEAQQSE